MDYQKLTAQIQNTAKKILESSEADIFIGWGKGTLPNYTTPVFITSSKDVDKLIYNEYCLHNLSLYLTRSEFKKYKKKAILAKGCDIKSIIGLIQELQVKRSELIIVGVACEGVKSFYPWNKNKGYLKKCSDCDVHIPKFADYIIGDNVKEVTDEKLGDKDVDEILGLSYSERWQYWQSVLNKCIKCYACRSVCPLCYCNRCFVERTRPQWTDPSSHPKGILSYHIFRAFHLAGRCVECEECERVCPVDIPLMKLNRFLRRVVQENFSYKPGYNPDQLPPLTTFKFDDPQDFIK